MYTTREVKGRTMDDESQRRHILDQIESLAIDFYKETGVRMTGIEFSWTTRQVDEKDVHNRDGEEEIETRVDVCASRFI